MIVLIAVARLLVTELALEYLLDLEPDPVLDDSPAVPTTKYRIDVCDATSEDRRRAVARRSQLIR